MTFESRSTNLKAAASYRKLQNKAARIVANSPFCASAAPLLQRLGWASVQKLMNKETGSMIYKSLDSLAPRYLSDLFVRLSGVHPRELRNSKTDLAIPMLRTGNGQKSFAYRGGQSLEQSRFGHKKWLLQYRK